MLTYFNDQKCNLNSQRVDTSRFRRIIRYEKIGRKKIYKWKWTVEITPLKYN